MNPVKRIFCIRGRSKLLSNRIQWHRWKVRSFGAVMALFLTLGTAGGIPRLQAAEARFFLMGDGKLTIMNMHTEKVASISLLTDEGALNEEGFKQADAIFGFPTEEKGEHVSPRLLFMLDHFTDLAAPGKVIRMISAYRSPEYNDNLRDKGANAAKTSQHMDGMALDFYIDGVNGKVLWELIRSRDCCGVGHYGGSSVHLDSGRPRFWEAATSKVRTSESDHNRRIYLSTDYDRYRAGERLRLSLSSVSEWGFGVNPVVSFVPEANTERVVATTRIEMAADGPDCSMIQSPKASRFILLSVPSRLYEGRYRVRVDFCRRPSPEMPTSTLSNVIELIKQ